MTEVYKTD